MKKVLSVLLVSVSLFASDAAVTAGMSNGRAWNGFGGGDEQVALMLKFVLLVGLSDGFHQARDEVRYGLDDLASALSQSKSSATRLEGIQKAASDVVPNLLPTGGNVGAMIVGLNKFYSDPLNLEIPIPVAARYQKAMLEGRVSKDDPGEEHLRRLRLLYKVSNELDSLDHK